MSAAVWINDRLYLGQILIGRVTDQRVRRPDRAGFTAFCFLPGARMVLGDYPTELAAKEATLKSAQSRIKGLFGAGIETTDAAVQDGRALRSLARTILRAGVWTCDRPVNAGQMFEDLRRLLRMPMEEMPTPIPAGTKGKTAGNIPPKATIEPGPDWHPLDDAGEMSR